MQPEQQDHDTMLSVSQVARLCGLNAGTVRYWITAGRLHALDLTGNGGHSNGSRYRITRSELRRFIDDCKLTRIDNTAIRLGDENDERPRDDSEGDKDQKPTPDGGDAGRGDQGE